VSAGVTRPAWVARRRESAPRLGARDLAIVAAGGFVALIASYELVHGSTSVALGLACLPLLAVALVPHPSRALVLGLVLILTVPSFWNLGNRHVLQYAALLAAFSAFSGRRVRLTLTDCAVVLWASVLVLGWLLQYDQPQTWHLVLTLLTPIGFYIGARKVPHARLRPLMAVVLFAGAFGALTVIYESWRGHALFIDTSVYRWNSSGTDIFRPGGIFSSPVDAIEVLCYVLFFGLASVGILRGRLKALGIVCLIVTAVGMVLTYTRAGLIGAGAGLILFLWLVRAPVLRPVRLVPILLVIATAFAIALPTLEQSTQFQEAIVRPGTFNARTGYWKLALPVATANPHNVVFGLGTGILGTQALTHDAPLPFDVAVTPQTYRDSLHNQYITTFVEEGLIGLTALVLLLLSGFAPAARAARATGDLAYAAISASLLSTAIIFLQDSNLDQPPSVVFLLTAIALASGASSYAKQAGARASPAGHAQAGDSGMA
jgi:hypothetical protein